MQKIDSPMNGGVNTMDCERARLTMRMVLFALQVAKMTRSYVRVHAFRRKLGYLSFRVAEHLHQSTCSMSSFQRTHTLLRFCGSL